MKRLARGHLWEATPVADRLACLALVLVALAGCGTSRDQTSGGAFDGGTGAKPLGIAMYLFDGGCDPASLTPDFDGNLVCADASSGVLHVLDGSDLSEVRDVEVSDAGWQQPLESVGRGGQAFLTDLGDGGALTVYALDLNADAATPIAVLPPGSGFHARRDAPGFIYAPAGLNQVWLADETGTITTRLATPAAVQDLASAGNGTIYASTVDGDRCTGVVAVGRDGGFSTGGGVAPCMLGLSQDAETIWLASSSAPDALVHRLDARTLSETGAWTVPGFALAAHSLPVAAGNGDVALLGASGPSVAFGRAIWLDQDGGFLVAGSQLSGYASDGFFDDTNALYVTLPDQHSVAVVR